MHTRARTAITLTTAGLLALTACGSSDSAGGDATSTSRATASASSNADTETLDAEQVVKALTEALTDAKPATVYTAATDPNKLLGRPGGYTSKADWTDRRATPNLEDDAVQLGGSVEVYDDAEEAEKREKYIAAILDGAPMLGTEYHYVKGGILLRVSGALTPEQAAEYESALARLA